MLFERQNLTPVSNLSGRISQPAPHQKTIFQFAYYESFTGGRVPDRRNHGLDALKQIFEYSGRRTDDQRCARSVGRRCETYGQSPTTLRQRAESFAPNCDLSKESYPKTFRFDDLEAWVRANIPTTIWGLPRDRRSTCREFGEHGAGTCRRGTSAANWEP